MSRYNYSSNGSNTSNIWILIIVGLFIICGMGACSNQAKTKNFGGSMDLKLEPNQKLVEITWKDDSLWYVTKPMTEDDIAENYTFQEKDAHGLLEGTVFIYEQKMNEEELKQYYESLNLANDYYRAGNLQYDNNGSATEIYIHYDYNTETYIKLKDYTVDEISGELLPVN